MRERALLAEAVKKRKILGSGGKCDLYFDWHVIKVAPDVFDSDQSLQMWGAVPLRAKSRFFLHSLPRKRPFSGCTRIPIRRHYSGSGLIVNLIVSLLFSLWRRALPGIGRPTFLLHSADKPLKVLTS